MPIAKNIPLSLYVHIPWCKHKCPYCDFNSYTASKDIPETNYLDALLADFKNDLPKIQGRKLHSIFIGGGTPSLLSAEFYQKLLESIEFTKEIEITIEANPGTINKKQLQALRNIGINRISIGVQSLQDDKLQALGRIHNSKGAKNAIKIAQDSGFNNINIDLMFGIPKQTIQDAIFDLEAAATLQPTHLSWYQLTIEPKTVFHKKPPVLPDEDTIWEMQQQGQQLLAEQGFNQYEISAYSKPGFQCQHNLNYWLFGDYLGIGAGAHGKITTTKGIVRTTKPKDPKKYIYDFFGTENIIAKKDLTLEFMMNALRLYQPIPVKLFKERTGLDFDGEYITITDKDRQFLDDVLTTF